MVNNKVKTITCELEDLSTGCTYIKSGKSIQECIDNANEFFLVPHKFKVLWKKENN